MLRAPLSTTAAKLDISRLLDSSPPPQFRPEATEPARDTHAARSASDPPPARGFPPGSQRSSISSTHSGSDSYAALSASSLPPQLPTHQHGLASNYQQQQPHQRPRIPSMSSLPLIVASLPSLDIQRHQPMQFAPVGGQPDPQTYSFVQATKRSASGEHASAPPAKRQSKWTAEEDALVIELRGAGMKWEDISKRIPGRTPLSCRLHYQNYIERRSQWDEDRKNRLARLYERLKPEMWKPLATELNVPWRAAEAMHWQLGQVEMARRAGVTPFSISSSSVGVAGSRLGEPLADTSPTSGYVPISSFVGSNYVGSTIPQSLRHSHLEERDIGYRGPIDGRARSISVGSGDESRGSGAGLASTVWPPSQPPIPSSRSGMDGWSLPRPSEADDGKSSVKASEYRQLQHYDKSSGQQTPR